MQRPIVKSLSFAKWHKPPITNQSENLLSEKYNTKTNSKVIKKKEEKKLHPNR